jgi:cytochrome c-type biogenesis protein CcmE
LVTVIVALLAFGVVLYAFSNSASPYVTVSQARKTSGDRLHIAGNIVKDSVHLSLQRHVLEFDMKDSDGALVHVVHEGEQPENLAEANRVVAIGKMKGNEFISQQLLVKCPSKYEAGDGGKAARG